jgi:hypothetical protein
MIGPTINASGTTQILFATKPVDFRNYAERAIMLSGSGMLRPAAFACAVGRSKSEREHFPGREACNTHG